jgi:hypothetical protein
MAKKKHKDQAPPAPEDSSPVNKTFLRKADGKPVLLTLIDLSDNTHYFGDGSHCTPEEFANPDLYELVPDAEVPPSRVENADKVEVEIPKRTYPTRTTTRDLPVRFSIQEIEEHTNRLTFVILEVPKLQDEIKRLKAEQQSLASIINEGQEVREVTCQWKYDTAGKDAQGEWIPSSTHKTLVRLDTAEAVETVPMTAEDRQMELSYSESPAPEGPGGPGNMED